MSSSLPDAIASGDENLPTVRVLYLGNDYYEVEPGVWVDANRFIIDALESSVTVGFEVDHVPPHPLDAGYRGRDLDFHGYDVVIFSEVWRSHFTDEQLSDLEGFVAGGGGFVMFGGWGGFGGLSPYGGWDGSIIEWMLPFEIKSNDDAVDMDFKLKPDRRFVDHPVLHGLRWKKIQKLHGYNEVKAKRSGRVLVKKTGGKSPILVVGGHGEGRVVAFASNPAGGWGMDFVEWGSYAEFLQNMVSWSADL